MKNRDENTGLTDKKRFIPVNNDWGEFAVQSTEGCPSYTITLSARYDAIIKSCSTTNAVFFACRINLLMTFEATIRCSESRYALGSSIR
jgi:hypothetical protein